MAGGRPGLVSEQRFRIRVHELDEPVQVHDHDRVGAVADDVEEVLVQYPGRPELLRVLRRYAVALQRVADCALQRVRFETVLAQAILRAFVQRLKPEPLIGKTGQYDDGEFRRRFAHAADAADREPVGHRDPQQHRVDSAALDSLQRGRDLLGQLNVECRRTGGCEQLRHQLGVAGVLLHEQHREPLSGDHGPGLAIL